jgi:nicotinate dehydrogenase subunit B
MKKGKTIELETLSEKKGFEMPRRDFLKLFGSGAIIFFLPRCINDVGEFFSDQDRKLPKDYNAFLLIAEDGTVSCLTGKIEMGQGIITSLAQMMADELNVQFEKVKMVMGDTDLCPWDIGTWGSMSTRIFGPSMRAAAAEAKAVLIQMASEKLKVPVNQLDVKDGIIFDTKNSSNSISYGQLTKGKRIEKYLDVKPSVEDYTKFTIVGKSFNHQDGILKVTGAAKYSGDYKLPGMVFARIVRPPSHGAKLTSVDYSEAEKIKGVKVVRDGDLVAVLHENRDIADETVIKIKAEYSFKEMPVNDKTIFDWLLKADSASKVESSNGDLDSGQKLCEKVFDSEFHDPYLAHAPMEPHTALANIDGDKITVWASTQNPFGLQEEIVQVLGFKLEKVRVITPFVGGGFGGKSENSQALEAAKLAKLSGKPVMVAWTREEEFFYDRFHPAGVVKLKSGIDKSGLIKFWDYHAYFCGTRGTEIIYDVPNIKITEHYQKRNSPAVHPFNTGPWRAPNNNTNTFAREVQIDIMAAAAGIDPFEFRLKNLKDERMITCLKAAADKFGYSPAKGPSGRGIGIAIGTDVDSLVAHFAEVKIDKETGKITVVRIVCVQDMGLCVNPEGATIQMEGCLTMGLGYSLAEEVLFEGGKVLISGFGDYIIPRFSWLPKIETEILQRIDQPPHGGGEPAIIAVGAVIANAVFDATGIRLYRMTMTPERISEALMKK